MHYFLIILVPHPLLFIFFFFNDTATTEIYTLSLHRRSSDLTRRHVDVLSRCFDFIHLNDLPRQLYRRGKKPFCLLTFDDGKRSNATAVAPELERLGVPAVF